MSTLLEQASLVMIPSGYKEDVVYSQIPTDGSGDLSFTRASNGTRVNSAGLVEVAPWNLVSYSEDFTSGWPKTATITANTTANPINGAINADTITGSGFIGKNIASIGVNTFFVYAKANSASVIRLNVYDGSTDRGADYNLLTGAISGIYGSPISTNAENVGNGWWKISITTNNANYSYVQIHRDSSGTCYIWGAQLNIGSTAKPYFPTTDRLNVPRLTYQNGGGGCPSLLLEKQSTNLVSYSEQFDNASWSKVFVSITANGAISPDGTQNADTLIADGQNAEHQLRSSGVVSLINGTTYTTSIYAKAGTNNYIQFVGSGAVYPSTTYANFDLSNGTLGDKGSNVTSTIESVGNGWYRCTMTATANASSSTNTYLLNIVTSKTSARGESNTLSTSVFLWGAQIEASSYATSYIPTTSSSATRVADACFKTGISSLIGQTQGTIFVDFQLNQAPSDANGRLLQLWATNDTTNAIIPIINQSRQLQITTFGSNIGSPIISAGPSTLLGLGQNKIAVAYTSTSVVVYRNGVLFASGDPTLFFPASLTSLDLGGSSFATRNLDNPINQAALFKTRLTNAELASITSL